MTLPNELHFVQQQIEDTDVMLAKLNVALGLHPESRSLARDVVSLQRRRRLLESTLAQLEEIPQEGGQ